MEKQATEFYRNRTNPDGLYNNCKECFASNSKRRQEALPPIEERMAASKVRMSVIRSLGHGLLNIRSLSWPIGQHECGTMDYASMNQGSCL